VCWCRRRRGRRKGRHDSLRVTVASAAPQLPWGDQGDGTYRNAALFADFSDPDVVRVGDDFYLVASDFHFVGIQVLHSRDLVNWTIVGQVFGRLATLMGPGPVPASPARASSSSIRPPLL